MTQRSFGLLCTELSPFIKKRDTNFRKAISVHVRVAITLYRLADTANFRTIANLFGVGKSTVCGIVREICTCIVHVLLPRLIKHPKGRREIEEVMEGFERRAGLPQVVGAVDGCHIDIATPVDNSQDYVNRKGFHSIILQGFVDSDFIFRDICVGWPGKVHDSRVFKNSQLYRACCAGTFLPLGLSKLISGQIVRPLIIGDSAYGLQDWLMKPYTNYGNLSPEEVTFNKVHSTTRVVVENTFGRLKGRFRCLGKRLDLNVRNCCVVISACCVLHNYCEIMKEEFDLQWLDGINLNIVVQPGNPAVHRQNRNAIAIRNALKRYLV